ncbi:MAG: hypothetical protein NTZ05_13585 [Chloroflexi bacterium]|nr:hypothetical protein [Chloroflexota bacterium]
MVADDLIAAYLAAERAGRTLPVAVNICHPELMSPSVERLPSLRLLQKLRFGTAHQLYLRGRPEPLIRPRGGWPSFSWPDGDGFELDAGDGPIVVLADDLLSADGGIRAYSMGAGMSGKAEDD